MSNNSDLLYGVEPSQIYLTVDPENPIINQLNFYIANPNYDKEKTITFLNPKGLTPDDELPDIYDETNILSRIYIWFPYGKDQDQDLTTKDKAVNITVSPGSHNDTWYCKEKSDAVIGPYWILFPKKATVLDPQESVAFSLTNIISDSVTGMSYMYIKNVKIPDVDDQRTETPIYKVEPVLIESFKAEPKEFVPGQNVELKWITENATSCFISPTIGSVPTNGTYIIKLKKKSEYKLSAFGPNGPVEKTITISPKSPGWYLMTKEAPWKGRICNSYAFQLKSEKWFLSNINTPLGKDERFDLWETEDGEKWNLVSKELPLKNNGWNGTSICIYNNMVWAICCSTHEVWKSVNGVDWELVTNNPEWHKRNGQTCTVFKDKLWVMGGFPGFGESGSSYNDVWASSDGAVWKCITPHATWSARIYCASIEYNNKLWLVGGRKDGNALQELWSTSDGKNWTKSPTPPWRARELSNLLIINNKLWMIGSGTDFNGSREVWVMDELEKWKQIKDEVPLLMGSMGVTYFNYSIWLAGGFVEMDHPAPGEDGRSVWCYIPSVE